MSDALRQVIADLERELEQQLAEAFKTKKLINALCEKVGESPRYPEQQAEVAPLQNGLHGDEFVDKPLAVVVANILESRKEAGLGPAGIDDLYATMVAGGYPFDANEIRAKRGLAISLAKNSGKFLKLTNGKFGLRSWYRKLSRKRSAKQTANEVEVPGQLIEGGDQVIHEEPDAMVAVDGAEREDEIALPSKPR